MAFPVLAEDDFIQMFRDGGSPLIVKFRGGSERAIYARRARIEKNLGIIIRAPSEQRIDAPGRIHKDVRDGVVLIGSDCHYWPGIVSTAHRAFVKFCKTMKPELVIMNGDVFDGASISRHAPIMWEKRPKVIEELETCKERLGEIAAAAGKAERVWTLGNHDARFESRLALSAPEYANVHGLHLKDHFPDFENAMSCWINDLVVVKHRNRGGIHATHNNSLNAGMSIVTGHLHSLKVTPITDYRGIRWGIDCGTLADPTGPQFGYAEDNPMNHRSGFIVLNFRAGKLLWPEICYVVEDGVVGFRNELIQA